mmetsp:Transcript_62348/g.92613  ORF Transcript_62348/g.92613 Transcript_62348/m.92613 type:complete len:102 (+) Transcript_62348:206-511(+)
MSTILAVISSCFDLCDLPFGDDISMQRLGTFHTHLTLLTITSDTVAGGGIAEERCCLQWELLLPCVSTLVALPFLRLCPERLPSSKLKPAAPRLYSKKKSA